MLGNKLESEELVNGIFVAEFSSVCRLVPKLPDQVANASRPAIRDSCIPSALARPNVCVLEASSTSARVGKWRTPAPNESFIRPG